jgi:hypothetical protein
VQIFRTILYLDSDRSTQSLNKCSQPGGVTRPRASGDEFAVVTHHSIVDSTRIHEDCASGNHFGLKAHQSVFVINIVLFIYYLASGVSSDLYALDNVCSGQDLRSVADSSDGLFSSSKVLSPCDNFILI